MKYKRITILRDPRTSKIRFLESFPSSLETKLTKEEWERSICEINEALRDKITIWSIFRNLSVITFLLGQNSKNKINEVLNEINQRYKNKGVFFCNPRKMSYQVIIVIRDYK